MVSLQPTMAGGRASIGACAGDLPLIWINEPSVKIGR